MEYTLPDFIGNVGVAILIGTYFALMIDKIKSSDLSYSLLNLAATVLITVSLFYTWNLSSFLIEMFWFVISMYGIWKWHKQRNHNNML